MKLWRNGWKDYLLRTLPGIKQDFAVKGINGFTTFGLIY